MDIQKIKNNDVFCLAPWTHALIDPNSNVYPCCLCSGGEYRYGSLNEKTLKEIWNSEEIKQMRLDMLNGIKRPECSVCYTDEKIGRNSYRNSLNESYSDHFNFVKETKEDGTFERFNLVYWDFRLSNDCNFKCRMCGPYYSSTWAKEILKENPDSNIPIVISTDTPSLWEEIEELFPITEEIYFAGGEPLIMDSHYKILDKLIEYERFDIKLCYSTNFNVLTYQNKNILDYWEKFTNLTIKISVDGAGKRGELIRKGLNWNKFITNVKEFHQKFPNNDKKIQVCCTVQLLNSFHVIDLHKKLYEEGVIKNLDDFYFNFLEGPAHSSVHCLPLLNKKQLIEKIKDYINNYLKLHGSESSILQFKSYAKYLILKSTTSELQIFIEEVKNLDKIRNENTRKIFPEFEDTIWKPYLDL